MIESKVLAEYEKELAKQAEGSAGVDAQAGA